MDKITSDKHQKHCLLLTNSAQWLNEALTSVLQKDYNVRKPVKLVPMTAKHCWCQIHESQIIVPGNFLPFNLLGEPARGNWEHEDERSSHVWQEGPELIGELSIYGAFVAVFAAANCQPNKHHIHEAQSEKNTTSN